MKVVVPEHIILAGLRGGLNHLKQDLNECLEGNIEEKSILYTLLNNVGNKRRYSFYSQAKELVLREEDHERYLHLDMIYNAKSDKLPSIYLSLSDEQPKNNTMNFDEDSDEVFRYSDNAITTIVARKWRCVYNIVVVDDNLEEIVLIYQLIKIILLGLSSHFSVAGLDNIGIAGGDIRLKDTLAPSNMATRGLTISFDYSSQGVVFNKFFNPDEFVFEGSPKV